MSPLVPIAMPRVLVDRQGLPEWVFGGALIVMALGLPVAFALRATSFYRIGVLRFGSLAVAALAGWWFIQRAFDLAPA